MDRKLSLSLSHIALVAPACLIVSILYDAAYFHVFGLSLSEIPSTINSHFKSSIDMFALVLSMIIFFVFFDAFFGNSSFFDRSDTQELASEHRFFRYIKENILQNVILVSCSFALFYVEGLSFFYVFMVFTTCVLCVIWEALALRLYRSLGDLYFLVFTFGIFSLLFICGLAVHDALSIKIKNVVGDGDVSIEECQRCNLMRVYDEYFIFWDIKEQRVKMISKDNVKILSVSLK